MVVVKRPLARAADAARGNGDENAWVSLKRKDAVFVEPVLIAEVKYCVWTDKEKLRHASFKEIRERADDRRCLIIALA